MFKQIAKFIIAVFIFSTSPITTGAVNNDTVVLIDKIVAVVNEGVVLQSELEREVSGIKMKVRDSSKLPPETQLRKQILENLIVRRLQLDEADNYGITIDDVTLNESMRKLAASNGISLNQLRDNILKEGMDYNEFRKGIKQDLILNQLRQGLIRSRIKISEAEIDDYLSSLDEQGSNSQYLISNIQVTVDENADAESLAAAKSKISSIYERLLQGEDFSKVAIGESDARNALQGGDLGWRKLSELPKQFANTLRNMTPGKISEPFQLPHGLYILKLRETKGIDRVIVKQVKARHILLSADKLVTNEQVRQQLSDLRKQILEGADFVGLAEQHSIDPGSAANGGDLGWAEPGFFTPEFRKVVRSLPTGKISQPFQSAYGWHIVEVLGWRDYDKTVDIARDTAFKDLYNRKAMIEEDLWISRLRSEAFIDIRLN